MVRGLEAFPGGKAEGNGLVWLEEEKAAGRPHCGLPAPEGSQRAVRQRHGCPELWVPIPGGAPGHGGALGSPSWGRQPAHGRGGGCKVPSIPTML